MKIIAVARRLQKIHEYGRPNTVSPDSISFYCFQPLKCTPPLELGLPSVLEGRESSFDWIKKVLGLLEVSLCFYLLLEFSGNAWCSTDHDLTFFLLWSEKRFSVGTFLQISYEKQDSDSFFCEALKNTWSQQRQKRRAERYSCDTAPFPPLSKRFCVGRTNVGCTVNLGSGDGKDSLSDAGNRSDCTVFITNGAVFCDASVQVVSEHRFYHFESYFCLFILLIFFCTQFVAHILARF